MGSNHKSVIVIGGGIAGLTAAMKLVAQRRQVLLLESNERLGGRIHTIRDRTIPIELGAEFIHGENPALARLLHDAKLSTHPVPEQNCIFRNGRLTRISIWERVGKMLNKIDPRQPDHSFAEFVSRANFSSSDRQLALGFVEGFDAADPSRAGAHALLAAEKASERSGGGTQRRLNNGYGALVEWMEHRLRASGALIRTGAAVRTVIWKPGEVEVCLQTRTGAERLRAKAALIALPLGVLKKGTVRFQPALTRKREAIDELEFGNVVKILLRFRQAWWPEHDFGFIHSFSDALPTWWSNPLGPVLTGWAGGPKADALTDRSVDELQTLALSIVSKLFSERRSALARQLLSAHTHNWRADENIHGAYSYIRVGGLDLPRLLAEPVENTLFFAGEAAVMDAQMGTVFGAIESAQRAADEISGE